MRSFLSLFAVHETQIEKGDTEEGAKSDDIILYKISLALCCVAFLLT
jgi:hypothetical protein